MATNGGSAKPDRDELNAALARKGARVECPVCDQADWGTPGDWTWVFFGEGAPDIDTAVEAYPMICQNCGFVRFHVASVLHDSSG